MLRDLSVAENGRVGIIATNTIAQGDTREVGLDQAIDIGWAVYRAEKSRPWLGSASIEVSLVWLGHPDRLERRFIDGREIASITPSLDPQSRVSGNPYRLHVNLDQAFQGCIALGMGFVLEPEEANLLLKSDPRNKAVLFPYLNGEDLNSRWDCSARRWIIDFNDWPIDRAMEYPEVLDIVEQKVRPERQRRRPDGSYVLRRPLPERWWQYADKRPALRKAIRGHDRVVAIALASKIGLPMMVSTGQVFANTLDIFADNSLSILALLSSSVHFLWWTTKGESTLETRLRYTPSDGFETFSQPTLTGRMEQAGKNLDIFRREIMTQRTMGLTDVYNLVFDQAIQDEDVSHLRRIHIEIDEAVLEAYSLDEEREPAIRAYERKAASSPLPSWRDIDLSHDFYETRQGIRFTISQRARLDVLDKLLALNHYRYEQEVRQGLHSGKGRGRLRGRERRRHQRGLRRFWMMVGCLRRRGRCFDGR